MGRPESQPSLRSNYLSQLENVAQSLGVMAPTGTLGVIIPLLVGKAGNGTWLVLLLIMVAYGLILLCINQFAGRCVSAGSLATYAKLGLGRWGGIVTGWAYVIAMTFGLASSAPSAGYYLDFVFRQAFGGGPDQIRAIVLTSLVVLASWWTAHRDIKLSTKLMLAIEWTSICIMVLIVGIAMFRSNHWIDRSQLHLAGITPSGLQLGLVFGFMAFAGAESVTALGEESRNAKRIVPKVIFGCLVPVGILHIVMSYCMVSYAHRHSLSLDELDAPFDTIANSLHLPVLGVLSSIGIAMSYFACALGSLNAAARVLFSMAKQQLFFKSFGIAHRANFTPAKSIMAVSLIGLISPSLLLAFNCTLTDCINYLTQLASFGCIAAYFAVCLATPFYLFAKKIPRPSILTIAVISLSVLGFILVFSVIPVPPPPWSFLPYIFLVMVAIGIVLSLFCGRNMGTAGREDVYAGSAAADDVLP